MAMGAPDAVRKVAGNSELAPGRVEQVWQTDLGHFVVVRSALGATTVNLEKLAELVHALPRSRRSVLHCGGFLPILLKVAPAGGGDLEEHAALAQTILGEGMGVEAEPGALKLDVPLLIDALNARLAPQDDPPKEMAQASHMKADE
jgi:hypothetical protein